MLKVLRHLLLECFCSANQKAESRPPVHMASLILRASSRAVVSSFRKPIYSTKYYSSMSGLLIEDPKYSWLKDLGLSSENKGVFDGTWRGSGPVSLGNFSIFMTFILKIYAYKTSKMLI